MGIEYIWETLETDGFTRCAPSADMVDALAHLAHSADMLGTGAEEKKSSRILPIGSYEKLVMFCWTRLENVGANFYNRHGREYEKLKTDDHLDLAREAAKNGEAETVDPRTHIGC